MSDLDWAEDSEVRQQEVAPQECLLQCCQYFVKLILIIVIYLKSWAIILVCFVNSCRSVADL